MNILVVENMIESEVLLTNDEVASRLLHLGTCYHVTPHWPQLGQYTARNFDSVQVGNSQHCAIVDIVTVKLNLSSGSTLILHEVR